MFAQLFVAAFQCNNQRVVGDILKDALDTAVVHFDKVLEQEHFVDNPLCQFAVVIAHCPDNTFFLLTFHQVDDLGCGSHATHFAALEVLAVQQVVEDFGQFRQCRRLHTTKGGDTQHDVVALAFVEQFEHIGGQVAF